MADADLDLRSNMSASVPPARRFSWRAAGLVLLVNALGAAAGLGLTYVVPATYTARTTFLAPQQQGGGLSAALASQLGSLAGLAGAPSLKSPADQYVALLESRSIGDEVIRRFKLREVYEQDTLTDTRKKLLKNVTFSTGKKDSLVAIEVDDRDPKRAAEMANTYIELLRELNNKIAVTEAQLRRQFFEQKLIDTKQKLAEADLALQNAGFDQSALRAEPKATAERYARLQAEVVAIEARLQAASRTLAETSVEIRQMRAMLETLRGELRRLEGAQAGMSHDARSDYVAKYRELKYQETLFELFARQYELARVDESREGAHIQVVDAADQPDKPSYPKKSLFAGLGALVVSMLLAVGWGWSRRRGTR